MCNAWNHPIECRCGWGGEGATYQAHGRLAEVRSFREVAAGLYKPLFQAYTNPNAKCPYCKALVYFFQSESGGRVFFDSLGPPWPKHSCIESPDRIPTTTLPAPRSNAWQPLLIESFASVTNCPDCYAVSAHTLKGHLAFFVRSRRLNLRAPFYIQFHPGGAIELSSMQPFMSGFKTVAFPGWRSILQASRAKVDDWSHGEKVEQQIFQLLHRVDHP